MHGNIMYMLTLKKNSVIFQLVLDVIYVIAFIFVCFFIENQIVFLSCMSILIITLLIISISNINTTIPMLFAMRKNYLPYCISVNGGLKNLLLSNMILREVSALKMGTFFIMLFSFISGKTGMDIGMSCFDIFYFSFVFFNIELLSSTFLTLRIRERDSIGFAVIAFDLAFMFLIYKLNQCISSVLIESAIMLALIVLNILVTYKGAALLKRGEVIG